MVDRNDFRIDVYRSRDEGSGARDWAVRVTHVPSGIMVTREGEGSILSDREKAIDTAIKEIEAQLEI
jgi:protein subunit release factor A